VNPLTKRKLAAQKARNIDSAISRSAVLLLLLTPVLLPSCGQNNPPAQQAPLKNVLVTAAQSRDVPVVIRQYGRISSPETVDVRPQVSGRITEVHFQEGQEVKRGDLLFVIDPRPFQADLEQAQAQLESDRSQLDLAKRNLARAEKIGAPQHFISEQQMDQDRTQVRNFQAATAKDQAAIDLTKLNLEYCYIRAPADGRTGRRLVDAGNYVATGGAVLINVQRQDPVYVDFTISENDLARLRENMPGNQLNVAVTAPAVPDKPRNGDLSFLDNSVSAQAGTVMLRATIPNADRFLWPGQYVNVGLTLKTLKDVPVVPSQTVQIGGKGNYLFVLKLDHTVEQRQVVQGERFGEWVAISHGVEAGETVVVEGQLALGNGLKVNPKPYESAGPPPSSGTLTENRTERADEKKPESAPTENKTRPAL
jgi:membrane fusion protein, multidrug efflux system